MAKAARDADPPEAPLPDAMDAWLRHLETNRRYSPHTLDGYRSELRFLRALITRPADLEDILLAGAAKARRIATPFLGELREAVGLRSFREQVQVATEGKKKAAKAARFVSFREDDGFRFRLLDAAGEQLLLSIAFADGKAAGQVIKRLQSEALDLHAELNAFSVRLDGETVAYSPEFSTDAERDAAMQRLREALAPQE